MAPIPDVLTCPDGVRAETLSALRDDLLPAAEAERLRSHVARCPTCQARIAQYDDLRRTLLAQPELEPGDRIVAGVRARSAGRPARRLARLRGVPHARRRRWSGLGALAAAAAVLLLFVYVLGTRPTSPLTTAKGTPSASATMTSTPSPTATATPQVSPMVDVATAWGTNAGTPVNPVFDGKHFLIPTTITPDGRYLAGNEESLAIGSVPSTNQPGLLEIAPERFQALGVGTAFASATYITTDGRFFVGGFSDAPGATGGVFHQQVWSYDSATGTVRHVVNGGTIGGLLGWQLSDGIVIYQPQSSAGLQEVTLATGAVRQVIPAPAGGGDVLLLAFTWPYLVYIPRASATLSVHVRDLSTGRDVVLHQLDAIANEIGFPDYTLVAGDSLFIRIPSGQSNNGSTTLTTLYELDHLLDPGATLKVLATYAGDTGPVLGANARVVAFQSAVWDRAEGRFVEFGSVNGGSYPVALAGNYLLVTSQIQPGIGVAEHLAIYDTSRLPVRTGT